MLLPERAVAHTAEAGLEGLRLGLLHPLTEPAQVLAVAALALVLGQQRRRTASHAALAFTASMLGVLAVAQITPPFLPADLLLLTAALGLGVVAAALSTPPPAAALLSAVVTGGLVGLATRPGSAPLGAVVATAGGGVVGATALLAVPAAVLIALRERADRPWPRIGMRIAASWLSAIAALLLALALLR